MSLYGFSMYEEALLLRLLFRGDPKYQRVLPTAPDTLKSRTTAATQKRAWFVMGVTELSAGARIHEDLGSVRFAACTGVYSYTHAKEK